MMLRVTPRTSTRMLSPWYHTSPYMPYVCALGMHTMHFILSLAASAFINNIIIVYAATRPCFALAEQTAQLLSSLCCMSLSFKMPVTWIPAVASIDLPRRCSAKAKEATLGKARNAINSLSAAQFTIKYPYIAMLIYILEKWKHSVVIGF